jgi:hypothetical protein
MKYKPTQEETPTKAYKRARPEGSTPTEFIRPPKMTRASTGPGAFKEALTDIKTGKPTMKK